MITCIELSAASLGLPWVNITNKIYDVNSFWQSIKFAKQGQMHVPYKIMSWQGNAELVKHRERLVSRSLGQAHEAKIELPYDELPLEALARMETFYRTSGSMTCQLCHLEYRRHPGYPYAVYEGHSYLRELCDGDLVKL